MRQVDLVHRAADGHRHLPVVGQQTADVGDGADDGRDLLELLRGRHILQVKSLHHLLFVVAPLGDVVLRHEHRIRSQRLPVGLGHHGQIVESLFNRDVVGVIGKVARRLGDKVLVEHHVDAGQFAQGLPQHLHRLIVHLEIIHALVGRFQVRHTLHGGHLLFHVLARLLPRRQSALLRSRLFALALLLLLLLALDHLKRPAQFLLGDRRTRVEAKGLLELRNGLFQLPGLAQNLPRVDMTLRSLKPSPPNRELVPLVARIYVQSLFKKLQRQVVLLTSLGHLAVLKELFALLVAGL